MGTRSITYIYDNDHKEAPVAAIYRQYDGYPSGHGRDLAKFFENLVIVNGIPLGSKQRMSNGAGDLAAQLITHFKSEQKNEAGGFYLMYNHKDPNNINAYQDYSYRIYADVASQIQVVVEGYDGEIFRGDAGSFEVFCNQKEED